MSLTIADTSGVVSAISNSATFTVAGLTLWLAYSQVNAWRSQKNYERSSIVLEEILQNLWELRDGVWEVKTAEIYARRWGEEKDYPSASQVKEELSKLRPIIGRINMLLIKHNAYSGSDRLSDAVARAVAAWEGEMNKRLFSSTLIAFGLQLGLDFRRLEDRQGESLEAAVGLQRSEADRVEIARGEAKSDATIRVIEESLDQVRELFANMAQGKST